MVYVDEVLAGLRSGERDRVTEAMSSAYNIIQKNPTDLEVSLPNLLELLAKLINEYEIEHFEFWRSRALVEMMCLYMVP